MREEILYALGDSHVRSFAFSSRVVPLFVARGMHLLFISEARAESAKKILKSNLRRVAPDQPVIIVIGEPNARFHLSNDFATRPPETDDHGFIIEVARRTHRVVNELCEETGRALALLSAACTDDPIQNKLTGSYNEELSRLSSSGKYLFVDIWPDVFDDRSHLVASSFKGDGIHMGPKTSEIAIERMKALGLLDQSFPSGRDFYWSHNIEMKVDANQVTRIWGDIGHDPYSGKFKNSRQIKVATEMVAALMSTLAIDNIFVVNAAEGFVPLLLVDRIKTPRIFAIESRVASANQARRLIKFLNEQRVEVISFEDMVEKANDLKGCRNAMIFYDECADDSKFEMISGCIIRLNGISAAVVFIGSEIEARLRDLTPASLRVEFPAYSAIDESAVNVVIKFRHLVPFVQLKLVFLLRFVARYWGVARDLLKRHLHQFLPLKEV